MGIFRRKLQGLIPHPTTPEMSGTTAPRHKIKFEKENLVIKGDLSEAASWCRGLWNC
jgi:hypothetical protein